MATAIGNTLAENFGGVAAKLGSNDFTLEEVPDLSGKTAVVTGGSQGVGYGCTHTLLSHNISKLFILSTKETVADDAIKAVREEMGEAAANKINFVQCDLSDWQSIKGVADDIIQKAGSGGIDILINNAAIGILTPDQTSYGVDKHMAVNHFGPVLFTSYLLPTLKETSKNGTVRIVNLSSNLHTQAKTTTFKDLEEINHNYGPQTQYGNTKLANLLYARYLARHLSSYPKILVNATHPGIVNTKQTLKDIHEPFPLLGYGMSTLATPFKKDQFEGCCSTMFAATKTDKSGQYVCPPAIVEEGSKESNDTQLGEQLMTLTAQVLKENGIEVPEFS